MNKLLITTIAAAFAVTAHADAAADAAKAALPAPVGQGAAVEEVVQVQDENVEPAPTASEVIDNYCSEKKITPGYDRKKNRILVTDSITFDVPNPKVDAKFVKLRREKISQLLITAKAQIIETIMSEMSGSRVLDIPGNPIADQIQADRVAADAAVAAAKDELAKLDKELGSALNALDSQATSQQTLDVITSYITEAEAKNLPASYKADQKAQYANVKAAYETAKAKCAELEAKADAVKGKVVESMKSSLSRASAMPIYGCTVLQQAESIVQEGGKYQYEIAILYAWSEEMMKAAGEILKGKSVKFKPGKKSIGEWLDAKAASGALSQWVGPRNYIDNEGNMWFIGIGCGPKPSNGRQQTLARKQCALEAAGEVVYSLFADASTKETLEKVMQTTAGKNGQEETAVYDNFAMAQQEAFSKIHIGGIENKKQRTYRHAPSGLDLQVCVAAVNSGNVEALRDIQSGMTALGIQVNTYQVMERGRQAMLKSTYEASKDNAAARAAGAENAAADLQDRAAKATGHEGVKSPTKSGSQFKATDGKTGKGKGKLRTGVGMITDDDE